MDAYAIYSEKEREQFIEQIQGYELPLKAVTQTIYPQRTPGQNAYYWGVVLKRISDFTGVSPARLHKDFKKIFGVSFSADKYGNWKLRLKSTTEYSTVSFEDYCLMIRAFAQTHWNLPIELPNEAIVNESTRQWNPKKGIFEPVNKNFYPIRD